MSTSHNVIIIGSGPAGYTAGIYTARANLQPIMLQGTLPGGQLMTTTIVENYPGFPNGIDGGELMQQMREQANKEGCILIDEEVIKVNLQEYPYKVYTNNKEYVTKSIIIATGATAKKLDAPGVEKYWNKGISACATCDGPLKIFRNKPLIVVGGGDTACEEALHLTKFGSMIYMLVRSNKMRASKIMQTKVTNNNKIKVLFDTSITHVSGEALLNKVSTINTNTGETIDINANGLFFGIGHIPNVGFLEGQVLLNENGYIVTDNTKTSIPGVFACGDVQDYVYRQAITAAGSGCMAAIECEKYLETIE